MSGTTIEISDGPRDLPLCREAAESAARDMGFVGEDLYDIVTAVFEASVNAFTHGCVGTDEPATVTIYTHPDRFEAIIRDHGKGFQCPTDAPIPPAIVRRGRGIPLMKALMDEVYFEYDNGCKVTLMKRLPVSPLCIPESDV
ncbi:MAG TPA: ATP-binding protein [Armatimonadota bacterium]|nr:ATP-binding protein [Armatimonadota bacterium]